MAAFFFILGRNPALSRAEIYSRLKLESIDFNHVFSSDRFCIFNIDKGFKPAEFLRHLGGTIKTGACIGFSDAQQLQKTMTAPDFLANLKTAAGRTVFGLSYYSQKPLRSPQPLKHLGLAMKKALTRNDRSARWVQSRENPLSSVIVEKNKLIEKGGEIVLLETGPDKLTLGKTLAVQEFADYSRRDYGRPERSMTQGMLPPKLARLMVNLAQPSLDSAILDPFCGSGTILQEARLLGLTHLYGTDNNPKAVADTRDNLSWLENNYPLQRCPINLQVCDVRLLNQRFTADSVDAIITEPYLGPPHLPRDPHSRKQAFQQIQSLYQTAFSVFRNIIKLGGRIVIVFPCWQTLSGQLVLPSTIIPNCFHRIDYPQWVSAQPFVYQRERQSVIREIHVLEKEKGLRRLASPRTGKH